MNNKNWIAVFLGLACLVLFVSVMGSSNNWLNDNNTTKNNGTSPQQINQTIKGMDNNVSAQDGKLPTEINASGLTSQITNNGAVNNVSSNINSAMQNMPKISVPQMKP